MIHVVDGVTHGPLYTNTNVETFFVHNFKTQGILILTLFIRFNISKQIYKHV